MSNDRPTDITHLLKGRRDPPMRCEPDQAGCVPHGRCVAYCDDGTLLLEITYQQGIAQGPSCDYWSDGRLAAQGQYAVGLQDGEWRFYHHPGEPPEVVRFKAGCKVVD